MIKIEADAQGVLQRQLSDLEREVLASATVRAINVTGRDVAEHWKQIMPQVFDRPVPLTLRAVIVRNASKARPEGAVFIRDEAFKGTAPAQYLLAQVQGGARRPKRLERALEYAGILPPGLAVVPGKGAKLDQYGNLPSGQITKILSQLRAVSDPGQNATATSTKRRSSKRTRGGEYFAARPGARAGGGSWKSGTKVQHLRPGVYERIRTGFGTAIRSVMAFVRKPTYKPKRFDIFGTANTIFRRRYPENLRAALLDEIARMGDRR